MTRIVVLALVLWCLLSGRQRCRAPVGWYVNGAQPDGSYELWPVLGRPEDDLTDAWSRVDLAGPPPVSGRIRCDGSSTPRQDGIDVWCQR